MQPGNATVAKQRRIGEMAVQFFRNFLGPAELGKIIVYDSNSHFILHPR